MDFFITEIERRKRNNNYQELLKLNQKVRQGQLGYPQFLTLRINSLGSNLHHLHFLFQIF